MRKSLGLVGKVLAMVAVFSLVAPSTTASATSQFTDFGQLFGEWSVSTLIVGANGKVYGGTHSAGHLFVFDPVDNSIVDKGTPSGQGIIDLTWGIDGKLYGGGQMGYLWAYDPATDSYSSQGQVPDSRRIIGLATGQDGTIYVGTEHGALGSVGRLFAFDPTSRAFSDKGTAANEGSIGYGLLSGPDGKIYGGTYPSAHFFVYDPATDTITDKGIPIPGERGIVALVAANDGKIYGGTLPDQGHLFSYDPESDTFSDRGQAIPGYGWVSALATFSNRIYGGSIASGLLFEYDILTQSFTTLGTPVQGEMIDTLVVAPTGVLYGGTREHAHFFSYTSTSAPIVREARLDIGMPYNTYRGCPSPYVGCGGPYHGFHNGVCTDLAMDAYNAGVPFDIQDALSQDHRAQPGRYRYGTARNAEDMRRYFGHNQWLLPHSQTYQPADIAFFDWNGDGLTNHVNVISEVDISGRPLRMVDATGVYAGNPSGRAVEHGWNSYYDQHVQAHGRLSSGLASFPSSSANAETLQVLRVTVDSPSVTLRLRDTNGKFTSGTYDENLVASNIESFIPYIPGGAYAELGTGKVISVTQPLSNTTQYHVELASEASAQYHLSIQTLQDGGVTASAYFTESIALGETQGITLQVEAPGGVISFVASTPVPMPAVSVAPGEIELTGLPGTLVQTAITVTETGGQQALNGVSAGISDIMNQNGQVVSGTLFTVTPPDFSLSAGGSQSTKLEIDLADIQPGIYQGSLLIASTNGGSEVIPLSLVVRPFDVLLPVTFKNAP